MLMPVMLRPQYQTIVTPTLNGDSTVWDGFCIISSFKTALLGKTGARVRITLTPPTAGSNLVIASAYVGMANTAPSFDGNQAQLARESDGATGFTLTAGGAVTTVVAPFRLTTAGQLLVALGITSGDKRRNNAGLTTDYDIFFKAADAANAGTTAKAGYTTVASSADVVSKIEVLN